MRLSDLRGSTFIAMVQAANFRESNDIAGRGKLYGTRPRALLAERKMCSGVVIVLNTAQMAFAEDDYVIQAFSADRTDQTLSVRVLPRRSRRSDDFRDPHRSNAMAECRTVGFVSVPQQIARCSVPGKGLGHLARKPVLRGIWRDLKVDNPSAIKT
jgi:hypothetical protein